MSLNQFKVSKKNKWRHKLFFSLAVVFLLTGCQKSTQFTYDTEKDPVLEVERVMDDLMVDYNPPVERMVIVAATLHEGNGLLQEHHLYDLSNITLHVSLGDEIVISVPDNPHDTSGWKLIRNDNPVTSQTFQPEIIANRQEGVNYDRLNFLINPEVNADTTFTLVSDVGERSMSFRVSIMGLTD